MKFWSGLEPTVIILDGSENRIQEEIITSLSDNIKYYHLPISLHARLNKGLKFIQTEYAVMLNDDEFFLPSGLESCILEIENSDIGACSGRSIIFDYKNGLIDVDFWRPPHTSFDGYHLSDDSSISRLKIHMYMYPYLCSTINAVTKKDIFSNNLEALLNSSSSSQSSNKIAYEIACSYQCKSKVINNLTCFRLKESYYSNEFVSLNGFEKIPFQYWLVDLFFENEKNKYIFNLVKILNKIDPHSNLELLAKEVKIALSLYHQSTLKFLDKPILSRYSYLLAKYSTKFPYCKDFYSSTIGSFLLLVKQASNKNLSKKSIDKSIRISFFGFNGIKNMCLKNNLEFNYQEIEILENLIYNVYN